MHNIKYHFHSSLLIIASWICLENTAQWSFSLVRYYRFGLRQIYLLWKCPEYYSGLHMWNIFDPEGSWVVLEEVPRSGIGWICWFKPPAEVVVPSIIVSSPVQSWTLDFGLGLDFRLTTFMWDWDSLSSVLIKYIKWDMEHFRSISAFINNLRHSWLFEADNLFLKLHYCFIHVIVLSLL